MKSYVVAASKDWFSKHKKSQEYKDLNIIEINSESDLNYSNLKKLQPEYIFFPHWNSIVDEVIYSNFKCVVFHTAPLPFGRGGSPIQNLILRGFRKSPLCAIEMTNVLDGGPIYCSEEVSLEGKISEIFFNLASSVEKLILKIVNENPKPIPQKGEIVEFKRLKAADNELDFSLAPKELFDRIRMVDGLDYPKAFKKIGKYRLKFSDASIKDGKLYAHVEFNEE
jgi:methionyl-tRNA formyltransferase